jgi:hypothetical protein
MTPVDVLVDAAVCCPIRVTLSDAVGGVPCGVW